MNLFFRADASIAIGTGHVMRCLALAQAWQDAGGRAVFAMSEATPAIQARLTAESCEVVSISHAAGTADDASQTIALARERAAAWIVVDGYQFTADYQQALKAAGFKVLFLDDYGSARHYFADVVLNQNVHANEEMYGARESYTRLLLGPRYCLLRREFTSWRGWKREIATIGSKVLVTMGGSDPGNLTAKVIEALRPRSDMLSDLEVTVVVGGSNPHFESLQRSASQGGGRFRLLKSVANMPELMAQADLAVAGAGTTCWEMCLLQLPLILIDLADNQKPIAHALAALGAAVHLGTAGTVTEQQIAKRVTSLLASEAERAALSQLCGKLVDGRGTERVFGELTCG
ncbi:MAG: UDP-2,4-diacetamido-2,4,6-trideoxy-beta-L-altropyranose hydrolase [Candidatus Sulfotelmatobacter sp.]